MATDSGPAPILITSELGIAFDVGGKPDGDAAPAVQDVSFTLYRSQVLALVGESGAGKSATAMSTLGLLPATATVTGSITLEGEELVNADAATLRGVRSGRIGTIFQEPMNAFNPVFTIGNQIAEALWAHGRTDDLRPRVFDLLRQVGLADPARIWSAYPHQLSGGQLQRAMIAMAISCEPVALIADEPTTALDVTVQAGILDLLRDLRDRLGTAILLITHDMGVVADLADDVVVLRQGSVVERASAEQLFRTPAKQYTRTLLDAVPRLSQLDLESTTEPSSRQDAPDPGPQATSLSSVVIDYAARRRGRVRAVNEVTLIIEPGQMLGLVGESGSGKSTVARALAGIVGVSSGSVVVAGMDMAGAPPRRWKSVRRKLGMVFQDPASSLNPRHTIETSIAEPLAVHTALSGRKLSSRVGNLLDAVQLPAATASRYPHELSGGQRQRVAVARAIALDPELLIADEPTSALDVSVQATVLDLFAELQERLGFGCLFISHDLAVVEQLVDRVAVMQQGRVLEEGDTQDVLQRPQDTYTRQLLAAAPMADPVIQRQRRATRHQLFSA